MRENSRTREWNKAKDGVGEKQGGVTAHSGKYEKYSGTSVIRTPLGPQ